MFNQLFSDIPQCSQLNQKLIQPNNQQFNCSFNNQFNRSFNHQLNHKINQHLIQVGTSENKQRSISQEIFPSNRNHLNIIFNFNGQSNYRRIKSRTTIKEALIGLITEELLNGRRIYATNNGKIINLENDITN
jgi:hypothetical protein